MEALVPVRKGLCPTFGVGTAVEHRLAQHRCGRLGVLAFLFCPPLYRMLFALFQVGGVDHHETVRSPIERPLKGLHLIGCTLFALPQRTDHGPFPSRQCSGFEFGGQPIGRR